MDSPLMLELSPEFTPVVEAVRQAALLCRSIQNRLAGRAIEKQDRSPVTIADFGSQAIICSAIREAFPSDPIIAEEDSAALRSDDQTDAVAEILREFRELGRNETADELFEQIDFGGATEGGDRFWTLDPIDGTKGFLRGEQYAISLALITNGKVEAAFVGCPNLPQSGVAIGDGVLLTAVCGNGCRTEPLFETETGQSVSVSGVSDPADCRFCESVESGHSSHSDAARIADRLGIKADPVRLDSQAKYAVVARGDAEVYLRLPTRPGYIENIWDHAGGALLVQEAGGTVTDLDGNPLDFSLGPKLTKNRGIVVSNGPLHADLLQTIGELNLGNPAT